MRGEVGSKYNFTKYSGITPAHAGRSLSMLCRCKSEQDHPRACGEKYNPRKRLLNLPGSPPRMRGEGIHTGQQARGHRITPAHAGRRTIAFPTGVCYTDHPRACGEKLLSPRFGVLQRGSPPRMRGKGEITGAGIRAKGITPAHAGKRRRHGREHPGQGDHPRACGEKFSNSCSRSRARGSPPRMRGKGIRQPVDFAIVRITPAHAGKSGV